MSVTAEFAISPGKYIVEALEDQGKDYRDLAKALAETTETVEALVAGEIAITEPIADRLSKFFSTSRSLWLNLEKSYRTAVEEGKPALDVASVESHQKSQKAKREAGGVVTLRVPKTMHSRIRQLAESEGVSMNQMLLSIISEGVSRYEAQGENDNGVANAA